jgi:Fic family protein
MKANQIASELQKWMYRFSEFTAPAVAYTFKCSYVTAEKALEQLVSAGLLRKRSKGWYLVK